MSFQAAPGTRHQTPGHQTRFHQYTPTVFQIKICGIRHPEDLPQIAAAGADAVGLNFYPASKRYLTPEDAAAVSAAV